MNKVWIVYRSDQDTEILGVFDDELEASRFNEQMADRFEGERIWIGAYPVPYRVQGGFLG
ncbi:MULTISPECIES: hypothetical protein [Microbacterium]|uniref:hypothetical protein n=1 Tax=Microbacterium TaxID=33882 RepID=UPI000CCE1C24|nr:MULTISPECIES: hypothetical protein [Microbacterium]MDZ5144315.1 hypothetical protein [Microbacterium testaceum]PNW09235.1 hypothetical protein C1632_09170 [Microbacterium testaceum]